MKILCVSHFDNGGQLQQLTEALNKYTEHDVKHLNYAKTFLDYDTDIYAPDYRNEELKRLLKDRDFFIFSEFVSNKFIDLGFKINRCNTIIRCFGTIVRTSVGAYRDDWNKHFTTYASGGFDPTIHPYLGFCAYHIPNIYDFSKFPKPDRGTKIKICQAATNVKKKNTKEVSEVLERLAIKYDIEPVIITQKSWKETLAIKAQCHITVDQFIYGSYAGSSIESMYLGHPVLSRISEFVRSMHPDIPIVQTKEDQLYDVLVGLLKDPERMELLSEQGHEYALREHSAKLNIKKWDHLIEWVTNGFY